MRDKEAITKEVNVLCAGAETYEAQAGHLAPLIVEILLDIRERLTEIYMATPEQSDIEAAIRKSRA